MPGQGPAPKPANRRARRNVDPNPTTRLEFRPVDPPELPEEYDWHPRTRAWWDVWRRSPMAALMSETDWSFMLDTAVLHTKFWNTGQWTLAAELRLRNAKFGATPEDRLRLRIQWADADQRDSEVPQVAPVPNRERYGELRALPTVVDQAPKED